MRTFLMKITIIGKGGVDVLNEDYDKREGRCGRS